VNIIIIDLICLFKFIQFTNCLSTQVFHGGGGIWWW